MSAPSYQEVVRSLEDLGMMPERAPSLDPMRRALEVSGLLPRIDPTRVIVVAGTNGKGSVAATLAKLLEAAGKRTGLYTSPHLIETTERIKIGGRDLSQDVFVRAYLSILPIIRSERLSHFEALTLLAAWVFYSGDPLDWTILEVGLGGTWDATNAIPHLGCVITSLGMDHENLLGASLASIARNKFGIVTLGSRVVYSPFPDETFLKDTPSVQEIAREVQSQTRSTWTQAPVVSLHVERPPKGSAHPPRYQISSPWGEAEIALPGRRGAINTSTALTALQEIAGLDPRALLPSLRDVRWPGRMELMPCTASPCPIYLSGDHNPQGIASLLELLPDYDRKRLLILAGVGKDKDRDGILAPLLALPDAQLYLTETPFRGQPLSSYGRWLSRARFSAADLSEAWNRLISDARNEDLILVTGSLYLVGAVRSLILKSQ